MGPLWHRIHVRLWSSASQENGFIQSKESDSGALFLCQTTWFTSHTSCSRQSPTHSSVLWHSSYLSIDLGRSRQHQKPVKRELLKDNPPLTQQICLQGLSGSCPMKGQPQQNHSSQKPGADPDLVTCFMARNPPSSPLLPHHDPQGTAPWTEPSLPAIPGCKNSFWGISQQKDLKEAITGSVQNTEEIWLPENNNSSWSFGCNTVSKTKREWVPESHPQSCHMRNSVLLLHHFCPSWNSSILRCRSKTTPFWDFWNTSCVFLPTAPGMQPSPSMYRCWATGDIQLFSATSTFIIQAKENNLLPREPHLNYFTLFSMERWFLDALQHSIPKQRNHIQKFFQLTFPPGAQQSWVSFRQLVPGMFFINIHQRNFKRDWKVTPQLKKKKAVWIQGFTPRNPKPLSKQKKK